jgi:hypothetical protein
VVVKTGGMPGIREEVVWDQGWRRFPIPFNRQPVVVEHHAVGWNME